MVVFKRFTSTKLATHPSTNWAQRKYAAKYDNSQQCPIINDETETVKVEEVNPDMVSAVLTTGQTGHWPRPPSCWGPRGPRLTPPIFYSLLSKNLHRPTFLSTERVNDSHVTS